MEYRTLAGSLLSKKHYDSQMATRVELAEPDTANGNRLQAVDGAIAASLLAAACLTNRDVQTSLSQKTFSQRG
jgi:hypothetical protein